MNCHSHKREGLKAFTLERGKFNSNKDWSLESLLERVIFTLLHSESKCTVRMKKKKKLRNYRQLASGVTGGGGGGRGQSAPPETSDREMSGHLSGKKRKGKKWEKGENVEEKKENCKGRWKIENGRGKMRWVDRGPFFLGGGCTKIEIFYREKAFHAGKKNQEKWLCPLKNFFPVTPLLMAALIRAVFSIKHEQSPR